MDSLQLGNLFSATERISERNNYQRAESHSKIEKLKDGDVFEVFLNP